MIYFQSYLFLLLGLFTTSLAGHVDSYDIRRTIIPRDKVLGDRFVKVETGIKNTLSHFVYNQHAEYYRFALSSNTQGLKARLELTTCYITGEEKFNISDAKREHLIQAASNLNIKIPTRLMNFCTAANRPIEKLHIFNYKMKIITFFNANFIITQWHGSPDPRILKDSNGCVARLSDEDMIHMCKRADCTPDGILNKRGEDTGLRYQHSGYPPLSLHIKNGKFLVVARSDDRYFKPPGGCSIRMKGQCKSYPQQQVKVLLKIPITQVNWDRQGWIDVKWKIKWSKYGMIRENVDHQTSGPTGVLLSNAWIRMWMNGKKMVDWKGPCGRNEQGRIPFFKIGVYNPSGNLTPINLMISNVEQKSIKISEMKSKKDIKVMHSLQLSADLSTLTSEENINRMSEKRLKFYKTAKQNCNLQKIK